ncbi:MAG: hypothetical protein U0903_12415 [Planctomycetales bacterium]
MKTFTCTLVTLFLTLTLPLPAADLSLDVRQITSGPNHHFFGYIGHVQNIPWNKSERYILTLRSTFQDRMPGPNDPADILLLDTHNNFSSRVLDQTRAWNPQQGTMLYWNPDAQETQFFFNDRDPKTRKIFTVLFDIAANKRVKEYRYDDTPVANAGVSQTGGSFTAINYARMALLRPVTGYKDATDWTTGMAHPADDGIFKIDIHTGAKTLLVSFDQLAKTIKQLYPPLDIPPLFINHTLWNREGDGIFFFARAGWEDGHKGTRINQPFLIHPNGTHLTPTQFLGGHPEWDFGRRMIGRAGKRQVLFDTDRQLVIGQLGTQEIFPDPEGDVSLSPDGKWFVNGFRVSKEKQNYYAIYRRTDGAHIRSQGFNIGQWGSGDLRLDPAPTWSRSNTQLLVPGLAENHTRQLFLITIHTKPEH